MCLIYGKDFAKNITTPVESAAHDSHIYIVAGTVPAFPSITAIESRASRTDVAFQDALSLTESMPVDHEQLSVVEPGGTEEVLPKSHQMRANGLGVLSEGYGPYIYLSKVKSIS